MAGTSSPGALFIVDVFEKLRALILLVQAGLHEVSVFLGRCKLHQALSGRHQQHRTGSGIGAVSDAARDQQHAVQEQFAGRAVFLQRHTEGTGFVATALINAAELVE